MKQTETLKLWVARDKGSGLEETQSFWDEEWRNVIGYENLYMISNYGRVKSFHHKRIRILKPHKRSGYYFLQLFKNGVGKMKMIHRLLAESFIPNPENKPCVDHINGNPSDNRVENLRWCTHKENLNNPVTRSKMNQTWSNKELRKKMSDMQQNRIEVDMLTIEGEYIKTFDSIKQAAFYIGVWDSEISRCCKNENKSIGGYKWRYTPHSRSN